MAKILLHLPDGVDLFDPDPELTAKRDVELVDTWHDSVIGVVGWSTAGLEALRTATAKPDLERLAIVATPFDEAALADFDPSAVSTKTLLLFGSADPETGSKHGRAWQQWLPNARLEMVPKGEHDLLVPMWKRVLSHLAPGRKR